MTALALLPSQPPPGAATSLANLEAEAAFLGAVLIDSTLLDSFPDLRPDHYSFAFHGRLHAAIREARDRGELASPASLHKRFQGDEALRDLGGTGYLARLSMDGQGLLVARELASQIIDLAERRRIIAAASDPHQPLEEITLSPAAGRTKIAATPYQWTDPASLPARPWVYGRWFLRGTVACIIAPGGVGKSTLIAGTALALVSGRELLGKVSWGGPKRVWLWNLEDDLDELSRSLQAAALHHGVTSAEVEGRLFVNSGIDGAGLCTATSRDGQFQLLSPIYDRITAELTRRAIDVLVIDPFVSSHEADENDNARIDRIAKAWARVAKAANCVVVLVHHASKAGSDKVTGRSARGAASLIDAARSTLVLNRMEEEEADRLGISAEDRRRFVSVRDDKSNRAPAEAAEWFRLASVDLGNAADGMPADSVAVAEPWKLPNPFDDVTVDDLRRVQARATELKWRESPQAADWFGKLVGEELGIDTEQKAGTAKVKAIIRAWIKSGAFRIAEGQDSRRETRKFIITGEAA